MVNVSNQQSGTTYPRAGSREPTTEEKQVFVTALTNINNEALQLLQIFINKKLILRSRLFHL